MVPAAIPASRAMSETRELKYPFRAKTRRAASMICCGFSGSRMTSGEPWFILGRPRPHVKLAALTGARLDSPWPPAYDPAHAHQIPDRDHAGPLAEGTGGRRFPVGAHRLPRAERARLAVAFRPPVLADAGARGHDDPGGSGRAHS